MSARITEAELRVMAQRNAGLPESTIYSLDALTLIAEVRRLRGLIAECSAGVEEGFMCALPPNDVSGQVMWSAGQDAREKLYSEAEAIRTEDEARKAVAK